MWVIALNDLRRRLRSRSGLLGTLVTPVAVALLLGASFGGDRGEANSRVTVTVVDASPDALRRAFVDAGLDAAALGPTVQITRARRVPRQPQPDAVVVLRGGGRDLRTLRIDAWGSTQRGRPVAAILERALNDRLATRGLAAELSGADRDSALITRPPATRVVDRLASDPSSTLGYFGPSMAVVFVFMGMASGARSILGERLGGTLPRLQSLPVPASTLVAGKFAALAAQSALCFGTLWLMTTLVFGARWGPSLAVVVMASACIIALMGWGLALAVVSSSEGAADGITALVGFGLAMLGGNFFPPGGLPPFFEKLALVTPNGWALEGFGALALDRGGLPEIVVPVLVLTGMGLLGFAGAAPRFSRAVSA